MYAQRMKRGAAQRKTPAGASPRVARRRERMKESLRAAAARQFASRGVGTVSVEQLLAEADVSRATFYGFFSSKYSLLEDILNPIFEVATNAVRALGSERPAAAVDGLIDIYLELWATHRDGLLLIPSLDQDTFRHFEAQHRTLNTAMLEVLANAERGEHLRNGSAQYSLKVIARTAIPLLRVYDGHPAAAALFRDALRGLLIRAR
jgi:AcrR family transcriptional regulator